MQGTLVVRGRVDDGQDVLNTHADISSRIFCLHAHGIDELAGVATLGASIRNRNLTMQSLRLILMLYLLAFAGVVRAFEEPENWARVLFNEFTSGRPAPRISTLDPSLDLDRAYLIQRFFQRLQSATDQLSGYRTGSTGVLPSQQYRLTTPIVGALFETGRIATGDRIDLADHPGLMIECHVGFVIDADIQRPPESADELAALIREVRPVLELPRLYFDGAAVTVPDLIAANGSGGLYILGAPLPTKDAATVNALFVEVSHDGAVIDRGRATNVMNDQSVALQRLIEALLRRGYRIAAGQVLLTGALGDTVPAAPGHYRVEFRDAGVIEFDVSDTSVPKS
jgi:2-oxo-3-hexenedioate decarboxylase